MDETDSILIDEARIPLVVVRPGQDGRRRLRNTEKPPTWALKTTNSVTISEKVRDTHPTNTIVTQ